jgi:tetratricopeptide (TPR) repeat protein
MNDKTISEQYDCITRLLDRKRLKEALTQIEASAELTANFDIANRCDAIKTSYQYMLRYMGEGAPDPGRISMFNSLLAQAYELNDSIKIALHDEKSPRSFYQCRRTYALLQEKAPRLRNVVERIENYQDDLSIGALISDKKRREIIAQHELALKDLFMTTWTTPHWSNEEAEVANDFLQSDHAPVNAVCLMVSAVTLSVMACFDARMVEWLMNAYAHSNVKVSQRALVGIGIIAHIHDRRISLYPALKARLALMDEEGRLSSEMSRVYLQMLLCQETEKIGRQMREEILPEMMKKATEFRNRMKDIEKDDDEKNPEWEELFQQSGIEEKMRQFNDLQIEGADVQMTSFASLKSFNFFRDMHHWFYPFDRMQQDIEQMEQLKDDKILDFIINSNMFCDSDKYSLCFVANQIDSKDRHMILGQFDEQHIAELQENGLTDTFKNMEREPKNVSNHYLHDLYRFFKLYFFRNEFRNIFNEHIELHKTETLKEFLCSEAVMAALSDFHLKKEHWDEAAELYSEIAYMEQSLSTKAELYQKMGYALQKAKRIDEAIEAYIKADTIKPNTLWTDKRLATCYRLMHDYENALKMYRKIEECDNGNANVTYYTGSCLVELNRCDEALNTFFKLDFSEENSVRAWRGIAWCSFIMGKYEQAMRYYNKVIETKPSTAEYMNAGHVAWCMGNVKQAVSLYRKVAEGVPTREQLIDMFEKEKSYLTERGIAPDEIALMIDLL